MISFPRELNDEIGEFLAHRARTCGGGAFELWEALCEQFGKKTPTAYIDGSPSDGWGVSFNDAVDGDCPTFDVLFPHPFEAADWCERNGFPWVVEHLCEGYEPAECLAKWRAEQ